MLSKKDETALKSIADSLGIQKSWLYNLINFESRFNPRSVNPYSSAKGLLQFTDSTARNLGYVDSQDLINKNPTIELQLKYPVYRYLKKYAPFYSKQSLYMSVFYPVARQWETNIVFPDSVRSVNPGINTVQDYIDKVDRNSIAPILPLSILILLILFLKILPGSK